MCWKFGLVNSTTQTIWKNRTEIITAFEQNRSRKKWFWKPEWRAVNEVLLNWFKQERSNIV